ncbi:PREDICTED: uncharacterized protein LOC18588290 [Theobroma cacao]|uniref:Uncharacterized protein LOC18588290 n=1 Tax=Theobroma cacao TaxID=3641 RepID=A0AB32WT00_THECC|nr:PREDICTED: uncharacterized protein LOC18588290 [Theobroma cacao]
MSGRRYLEELYTALLRQKDPSSSPSHANVDMAAFGELLDADAQRIRHLSQYIPLYKAALKGDRKSARRIFDSNPDAITARNTEGLSTALHIAVGTGKNIDFVRNLIDLKPVEALELTNDSNSTSLTVAAMVGNLEVARLLVERNPNLPYIRDNNEVVPLHRAVQYGHKNLVSFLLGVTRNEIKPTYSSPYADESGVMLLLLLVFPSVWRNLPNHPIEGDYPADCSQVCVQICSRFSTEVEKFVKPGFRNALNGERKTPAMVFTEEHKELLKEGEQWLKDTANSCTVVAALIATVVVAAAITVLGGNNADSGFPIFSGEKAFIIFAVADALSPFSSTAAMFMFLSILTACYSEADFLYALPKRLILCLLTLFISITFMMIAFSATLYIVFGDNNLWTLISIAISACLLVILFVLLQLLSWWICSTPPMDPVF